MAGRFFALIQIDNFGCETTIYSRKPLSYCTGNNTNPGVERLFCVPSPS